MPCFCRDLARDGATLEFMEDCWQCALPVGLALILAVFRGVPAPQLSAVEPDLAARLLSSTRGLPLLTAMEVGTTLSM